jgi:hypothetical protein
MAKIPEGSLLALFVTPGAFTDAGGYAFTPHGIVPIPGWGEEIRAALAAAVATYRAGEQMQDKEAQRTLQAAANKIVQAHAGAIREYVGQVGAAAVAAG